MKSWSGAKAQCRLKMEGKITLKKYAQYLNLKDLLRTDIQPNP